ncbi:Outer membrane protein assembly factor BamB, contains PQQ-like beta-propeller repeat [Methanococcoides vulcani]|uniref:Outer membrane protein assembly factor BamB, contains PQQ-like beta-propeller repeat n=1 Tax=Methanococcoides vulcani TaxID=1353158 RepID=A0A1H9Y7R8_9EURY|nr:Outer membrane protein assembly factor BamB, contains PQQ-like beta-propeller repeat [Methanococcoides vulcani]
MIKLKSEKRQSSRNKIAYLLIAILIIFLCPSAAHADDWNMWGHDSNHTSHSKEDIELPLELFWKTEVEGSMYSSPVASNGLVYVGSKDSYLHTFDAKTGEERYNYETFKYPLYATIASTPLVTDSSIFISSYDDRLYAYQNSGKLKWKCFAGRVTYSSPTIYNNTIYIGTGTGIYALGKDDGILTWEYETNGMIYSSPAVSEDGVYAASSEGFIYALNMSNGELIWKYTTLGKITSSPAIDQRAAYIGSFDKNIYALDIRTGDLKWKYETGGEIRSSPAISNDSIYIGSNDGYVYALEKDTSRLKWKYRTDDEIISSPALAGNYLFIASMDGNLYIFNAEDGKLEDKIEIEEGIKASLAITDNIVYLLSENSELYAFKSNTSKYHIQKPPEDYADADTNEKMPKIYIISGIMFVLLAAITVSTIKKKKVFPKKKKTDEKTDSNAKKETNEREIRIAHQPVRGSLPVKLEGSKDEVPLSNNYQKQLESLQNHKLLEGGTSETILNEAQIKISSANHDNAEKLLKIADELVEKENNLLTDIVTLQVKITGKDPSQYQKISHLLDSALHDLKEGLFEDSQLYLENAKKDFEEQKKKS